MKDKLFNTVIFVAGGFTFSSAFLLYKFLRSREGQGLENGSCINSATTTDESTPRTPENISVFNQHNNYIDNSIGSIQNADINSANQEISEFKKQQKQILDLNNDLALLREETENLKKEANTYKTNIEKKLDIIFKYAIQTNLEQCDTISWINPDLSVEQRKEMLDSLQFKVLEEAGEIARDNGLKINIPEQYITDITGHHFEAIE